jgi:hypothetical protein
MEIADYLRIARRRLWVLLLVPLLAAGAAIAFVLQSPTEYAASATLSSSGFVGGPSDHYQGTQAASQFAAAFTANAEGPAALASASKATGIPAQELANGLTVTQNGASSNMTLTYTSEQAGDIVRALGAVKQATINRMYALTVAQAKAEVDKAQAAVSAANERLRKYTDLYGAKDPNTVYQSQLARIAVRNLVTAHQTFQTAENQLSAAQARDAVFFTPVHAVGQRAALVRTVIPVVGAAIFLAVILVMMLELLASARQRARENELSDRGRLHRRGPGGPLPQGE